LQKKLQRKLHLMQISPFKSPNHEEDPVQAVIVVLLDLVQLIVLLVQAQVQAVILQALLVQAQAVILQALRVLQVLLVRQALRALQAQIVQIVHTVQVQL